MTATRPKKGAKRMKSPRHLTIKSIVENVPIEELVARQEALDEMMAASLQQVEESEQGQGSMPVAAPDSNVPESEEDHSSPMEEDEGIEVEEDGPPPNLEKGMATPKVSGEAKSPYVFPPKPDSWPQPLIQKELTQSKESLTKGEFTEAIKAVVNELMQLKVKEYGGSLRPRPLDPWEPTKAHGEVRLFLENLDTYLGIDRHMKDDTKVKVAGTFLKGAALMMWGQHKANLQRENREPTYEEFKSVLLTHYSEAHISDEAVSQMLELREKDGRHHDYRVAFNALTSQLPQDKSEALELILVALYKRGLTKETGSTVILDPSTGMRHKNLKRLQDQAQASSEVRDHSRGSSITKNESSKGPKIKKGKGTFKKPYKGKPKTVKGMDAKELVSKNLCFECAEEGHRARDCPKKKFKASKKQEN